MDESAVSKNLSNSEYNNSGNEQEIEEEEDEDLLDIDKTVYNLQQLLISDKKSIEENDIILLEKLNNITLKDLNLNQKQLLKLCKLSADSIDWLNILFKLINNYPIASYYLTFHQEDYIEFTDLNGKLKKNFTLQTWVQINDEDENEGKDHKIIFLEISTFLKIYIINNQLSIEISNDDELELEAFESFNFVNKVPYHVVITHALTNSKTISKFNLYVDGEFIQSLQITNSSTNFNTSYDNGDINNNNDFQVRIGNISKNENNTKTIDVANLLLINEVEPLEWILLSYYLLPGYSSNYQDSNLVEFLSYQSKNSFEFKLRELYLHSKYRNSDNMKVEDISRKELLKFDQIHKLLVRNGKLNLELNSILLNFHAKNIIKSNKGLIIPFKDKSATIHNNPSLWSSYPIQSTFYSIGGITIIFRIIENAQTNDHLHLSLNLLFELISKNWRNLREFEMKNGYDLVATILKTKKNLLNLKILDLILQFIGYNYNSPIDSILLNPLAYRSLILDFDIWKTNDKRINNAEGKETFKFLLFQFTVFFQESKYNLYNINKLVKMRIIKRFIQALKYESFGKDILPVVHNSLLILIKANPTAEIMRSLSLYIVYALNEKNAETEDNKEESLQKCCGICALDVLVSFICDPSLISSSLTSSSNHHNESSMTAVFYKKLSKSITVRWILLLLDDSNPKVVKLSLRLLIRMLAILGLKFYNNFIAHNGLDILATTLNKWWFDNEIVVLLYSGVFGISQSQDLGSDLVQFAKRLSKRGNKLQIAMPSFLYLINSLIIYGIEELDSYGKNQLNKNGNNEKFDDITLNLTSLLNSYIIASETSYENIISLKNFFRSDIKWLSDNLTILNKLDCLSYNVKTIEIINAYHNFIRILSHNFIELLFNNDAGNGKFPGNEGSVDFVKVIDNMQNQESSLVLHRLIYPKILEHMQNFKDVLPDLIINGDKSPVFLVCSLKFFESCYESLNSHKWNTDELLRFIEVISNVAEFSELKRINEKYVSKFKDILGDVYLKCFIESIHLSDFETVKKLLINHLLFHQTIYFGNDVLDNKKISTLITLLIKNCELEIEDVEISSLSINALRMLLLYRQNDIEKIVELISAKLDNKFTITANFFNALLVSSDEEVENKIFNDSNVSNVFSENFKIIIEENSTYLQLPKLDDKLVQISNNGFTANEDFINNFEKDNRNWKKSIVSSELSKYYRHIQDHQDNVQFYISIYNNMRIESTRVLYGENTLSFQWYVDSIEGANRMRKRLIPEFDKNDSSVLLLADSNSAKLNESNNENGNNNEEGDSNNREILTSTLSDLSSSSSKNAELTEGFELIDIDQSSTAEEIDLIQEDKNRKVLRSLYIGDKIIDLWNTSQILGLEAIESILIMGNTHLYLIKNYFHCSNNGEIVDIDDAPAEERDPYMQLIIGPKKKNNNNLATNGNNTNGSSQETKLKKDHQTKSWELEKLTSVSKRQFLFRDVALEFFFVDGSSFLITCKTTKERDTIYSKVSHLATGKGIDKDLSQAFKFAAASFSAHNNNNGNGASTSNKFFNKLSNAFNSNSINFSQITKKWQRGEMSNFYYLMIINTLAGRTFNDLTQYPVFPWVIADYSSEELDLSDPNIYRDLTRPMGGQGENRENTFKERYEALASLEDPDAPPFHYGTHYSSAMIVTSYLIRLEPYVQSYLLLQGGKFDHADRLFYSIAKAWNSASKENTTDVRELIPEFFYLPEFLTNENNYNFGKLQDGTPVKDVELPPWAKNDPTIFIQKNREALESPYASSHLHEWIDLIFGYKQRGQSAVEATNVFHHLSYNGAIDLDKIDDEIERRAMTGIIHNFGQTPLQIFTKAHPARDELQSPKLDIKKMLDIPISISESNLKLPIKNIELKDDHWKGHSSLYCNAEKILIRGTGIIGSLSVNGVVFEQLHNSKINALVPYGNRMFLTGSSDGTIHSWKYIIKSSFNSSSSVTIGRKDSFGDSKDGRNSNNSLNFLGVLRAHNSSVIDIKVAPAFNSALSLDERGNVWLLDLVRLNVVRKIKTNNKEKVQNIAIANDTGNIVAASATWIEVFTINGTLIISQNLYEYDPATSNIENKISAIDFAQPNWSFINSSPHHEYWEKSSIIVVGGINKVEVLELKVFAGKWNLTNFRTFNLTSENASGTTIITTVKMKLTTELDGDGTKVGSAEIVCGDNRGRVINWH